MSENLCPKVNMSSEDWDPDVITRMIILGPGARVSESEIVGEFHMLGLPLTIKNTCYGSMISGKKDDVLKAINKYEKNAYLEEIENIESADVSHTDGTAVVNFVAPVADDVLKNAVEEQGYTVIEIK